MNARARRAGRARGTHAARVRARAAVRGSTYTRDDAHDRGGYPRTPAGARDRKKSALTSHLSPATTTKVLSKSFI